MTTAMDVVGVSSAIPGVHELSGEWDRVMLTAADRPNTDTLPALRDPAADHEGEEVCASGARTLKKSTSEFDCSWMRPGRKPWCSG